MQQNQLIQKHDEAMKQVAIMEQVKKKEVNHSISPSFLLRVDNFQFVILKRGYQKKMNIWGDLKSSCHRCLHRGTYFVSSQKRLFNMDLSSVSHINLGLF